MSPETARSWMMLRQGLGQSFDRMANNRARQQQLQQQQLFQLGLEKMRMENERSLLQERQKLYDKQGQAMGQRANQMYGELQRLQEEVEAETQKEVERIRKAALIAAADEMKAKGADESIVSAVKSGTIPPELYDKKNEKYASLLTTHLEPLQDAENLYSKFDPRVLGRLESMDRQARAISDAMERIMADPRADLSVLDFGRAAKDRDAGQSGGTIDDFFSQYESRNTSDRTGSKNRSASADAAATPKPRESGTTVLDPTKGEDFLQLSPIRDVGLVGRSGEIADVIRMGLGNATLNPYEIGLRVGQDLRGLGSGVKNWGSRLLFGNRGMQPEVAPVPVQPPPHNLITMPQTNVPPPQVSQQMIAMPPAAVNRVPVTNRVNTLQMPRPAILGPEPLFLQPQPVQ